MKRILNAILIALAAGVLLILPTGDSLQRPAPALAASGATRTAPPNYSFDAASYDTGTPPTNHDFETGDLTGWIDTGPVTVKAGGPSGFFAEMGNGSALTSAAFALPSEAQTLKFDRAFLSGSSGLVVHVLSGAGFGTEDTIYVKGSPMGGPWETVKLNITPWAGQTIKLELHATILVGVDNVGIAEVTLPSWANASSTSLGQDFLLVPELDPSGPSGNFARMGNLVKISSGPFTVPENPPLMQIRRTFFQGSSGLIIHVLSGPGFTTEDLVYLESSPFGDPWAVKSNSLAGPLDVSAWAGQTIKLRVSATGSVGFDDPAFNFVSSAVLGWSSPGSNQEHPSADDGDPVDTSSGSFTHGHTDLLIPGRGIPLEFSRTYSSMSVQNGDLGHRWAHNYAWSLTIESDGDASVMYPSGGIARFDWNSGSQTFTAPAGNNDILVKNGDGTYTLTNRAQVKFNFASDGKLTSIADRNDNTTSLSYDVNDHLTTVTDPGGRTLTFSYDDPAYPDNITKITDPLPMPDTRPSTTPTTRPAT